MSGESPLCDACAESLYPTGPACSLCAEPREVAVSQCPRCRRRPPPYRCLIAPYRFGGELATALRRLKFRDRPDIARILAPLFAPGLTAVADDVDVAIPVPLSWRRRLSRGYNQAALLLEYGRKSAGLDVPIERLALRRRVHTQPQSGLSSNARARNVAGAFDVRARHRHRVADRRVLLFDDIATTGATLASATRALRRAGAADVVAMCVARAG